MSEETKRPRKRSAKALQREREEKFFSLVDRAQTMLSLAMAEEHDIKDIKQITCALKDMKDLIFDKAGKGDGRDESMVIKIEGDVE